jgi:NitT/TauT family transport system substrate-binding protein
MPETLTLAEPFRALFYAPFYLAEARGAFTAEGLALRMETAGTPSLAAEAVLERRADLAWSGPMRVMQHRARDPASPLTSFCAVVMRDPFLILGRTPRPGFALTDLAALRVGLVTEVPTPVWCLAEAVAQAGGTMPKDAAGASMVANLDSVLAGRLDAAQAFEPFAAMAEAAGGAVWHAQSGAGPMAYTALYARDDVLVGRRAGLHAMIRALDSTLRWLATAAPEDAAALLDTRFPEVPRELRARAIARYQEAGLWADGPRFPRAAFDALGAAMLRAGALPHIPDFDLCVDNAIVEEALA